MKRCHKCGHVFPIRVTLAQKVTHMNACDPSDERLNAVKHFLSARKPGLKPRLSRTPEFLRRR